MSKETKSTSNALNLDLSDVIVKPAVVQDKFNILNFGHHFSSKLRNRSDHFIVYSIITMVVIATANIVYTTFLDGRSWQHLIFAIFSIILIFRSYKALTIVEHIKKCSLKSVSDLKISSRTNIDNSKPIIAKFSLDVNPTNDNHTILVKLYVPLKYSEQNLVLGMTTVSNRKDVVRTLRILKNIIRLANI